MIFVESLNFQMFLTTVSLVINVEPTSGTKSGKTAYTLLMIGYSLTSLYA